MFPKVLKMKFNRCSMLKFVKRIYYAFKIIKEMDKMSTVYTTLIVMELKTYAQVPSILKEDVANELRALGLEDLIAE